MAGTGGQSEQNVRKCEEYRWLGLPHRRVSFVTVIAEEEEPGSAATDNNEHADDGDDQLELALWRRRYFGSLRAAVCLFVVRHRPRAQFQKKMRCRQHG